MTAYSLTQYAKNKQYLDRVKHVEQYDSGYCIFEDFLMLRQIFSNDLELNQVPTGGTVQSAEETADVIIDSSIKDTG